MIEARKQVCAHAEEARKQPREAPARLAYHQASRRPRMDGLTRWRAQPLRDRLVEPTSALGKASTAMQSQWETRTRF